MENKTYSVEDYKIIHYFKHLDGERFISLGLPGAIYHFEYHDLTSFFPLTEESECMLKMVYPTLGPYNITLLIEKLRLYMEPKVLKDTHYVINLDNKYTF